MLPVPEVLSDILPVSSKSIERELSDCERLVWKYTAIVEKLTDPDRTESEVSLELLKQALYNVRQLQVFLTMLLVSSIALRATGQTSYTPGESFHC